MLNRRRKRGANLLLDCPWWIMKGGVLELLGFGLGHQFRLL